MKFHLKICNFLSRAALILICQNVFSATLPANDFATLKMGDDARVLKTVNGVNITRDQVVIFLRSMQAQGQKITPDVEASVLNELILRELVASEARKQNLDTTPEVLSQMKFMMQQILVEAWFADYFKQHPITDEEARTEYAKQIELTKTGRNSNEYLVLQILVASENEANDISKRLDAKESFTKLAQEKSIDKGSAAQGGKLGWVIPNNIVKPLDDVIISLKNGSTSNPVQSALGWHILKVEDRRVFKIAPFEVVKANLMKVIMDAKRKVLIEGLAKKATIQ
jgi:peptidyl-prolyl cis-trans isomerase C